MRPAAHTSPYLLGRCHFKFLSFIFLCEGVIVMRKWILMFAALSLVAAGPVWAQCNDGVDEICVVFDYPDPGCQNCTSFMGGQISAYVVLVNEILHNVKQYMGGITVNKDSLAIDVIERVGPGGHYLQDQHTLDNFKKIRYSELFDRSIYDQWQSSGSQRFEDRLRDMTKKAMAHEPAPLPENVIKEIDAMEKHWK